MADIEFHYIGYSRHRRYRLEAKTVPGMAFQPQLRGHCRGLDDASQFPFSLVIRGDAIGPGMQFHHRRAHLAGSA